MGENVSEVTIGIMRLNGDIWLTVSVSDFGFVTSALALTLTALRTSQYIVFNVLSFVIQEAKDIRQIFSSSSFSCRNMNFLKIFHVYVHCNAGPNRTKSS